MEGLGNSPPPKKISCYAQKDKFGRTLPQFFNRQHESLGTRILQFNCKITKLTNTVKNYPKIHGQTKGGQSHHRPPPP